jgi:hypothetical protein
MSRVSYLAFVTPLVETLHILNRSQSLWDQARFAVCNHSTLTIRWVLSSGDPSSPKETLENTARLLENGIVIAGQDWVDGRQAALDSRTMS